MGANFSIEKRTYLHESIIFKCVSAIVVCRRCEACFQGDFFVSLTTTRYCSIPSVSVKPSATDMRLLRKLGYSTRSTTWLGHDLVYASTSTSRIHADIRSARDHRYVALKVHINSLTHNLELEIY